MSYPQHLRIPILLELFQKIREDQTLPILFYETSIILIPKPDKDIIRKENYRPISLMKIDEKSLSQNLSNQIDQHMIKWDLF